MNKRQVKIELLYAADELLALTWDSATERQDGDPSAEFISVIGDAIDKSLDFYDTTPSPQSEGIKYSCKSLKVSIDDDTETLNVKYMINTNEMLKVIGIDGLQGIFMDGGIDFSKFFLRLNRDTAPFYQTSYSIDDLDGTIECESRFNINYLIDYVEKQPQVQKLF